LKGKRRGDDQEKKEKSKDPQSGWGGWNESSSAPCPGSPAKKESVKHRLKTAKDRGGKRNISASKMVFALPGFEKEAKGEGEGFTNTSGRREGRTP